MVCKTHFLPGDIIIKENDSGESAYIIKQGRVRVTKTVSRKIIHLCDLEAGDIFGEMSMIDDRPRSATVTAIEDAVVHEIHRDRFLLGLKDGEELALETLKILLERLRRANRMISQLKTAEATPTEEFITLPANFSPKSIINVSIEGLTRHAVKALPENPLRIKRFPFLIGRKTRDPLAYNDLAIPDNPPYRISRHHLELDQDEDRLLALDRGSHLGSIVDGRKLGGQEGDPGPLILDKKEGTLVLGDKSSPYKYRIIVNSS